MSDGTDAYDGTKQRFVDARSNPYIDFGAVHRLTAALLVFPALALLSGDARRHVHAYAGHDHHEHHHGVAAHEHHHEDEPEGVHFDECEPGLHVVHITVVCAQSGQPHTADVDLAPLILMMEPGPLTSASIDVTDVRAHGPPSFAPRSLRAPPRISA